jgi:hypothetical protein
MREWSSRKQAGREKDVPVNTGTGTFSSKKGRSGRWGRIISSSTGMILTA